jgi:outer membrane protein OmpA-like peptidoglycan-associated protein
MKKSFILIIFISFTFLSFSQNSIPKKDSTNNYASWIFGLGLNGVNDNGIWEQSYFDFKKTWSFNWQTLNIDRHVIGGFYLNAMVSKNLYTSGIRRDTYYPEARTNFFSTDLNIKYTFKKIFPRNFWAEPYAYAGVGYTQRDTVNDKSFITHNLSRNIGIGTYIWMGNHWGLNFQASGKWTLTTKTNYKQNVIGIVYRIGVKRVKSKPVKNSMLYEKSIDDSLRIACNCDIDLTKIKANNGLDKNTNINIISGTGNVVNGSGVVNMLNSNNQTNNYKGVTPVDTSFIIYFDYDKYALTPKSIITLNEALSYLKIYPKSKILLNGHTDLHGSIKYNNTLSFNRVEATKEYLIKNYVNPFTISTKFESKLNPIINIMDVNVDHFNRRVEIVILR